MRTKQFFPYLFALYPVLSLYSRNIAEIKPIEVVVPITIAILATFTMITLLRAIMNDRDRAIVITTLTVFLLSSSELVYRVIQASIWHGAKEILHLVIVFLEVSLIILLVGLTQNPVLTARYGGQSLSKTPYMVRKCSFCVSPDLIIYVSLP